jgi:mono/diheme cytochrome c family protein
MLWKRTSAVLLAVVAIVFVSANFQAVEQKKATEPVATWDKNTMVTEVAIALGDKKPLHYIDKVDPAKAKMGEDFILKGKTVGPDGKTTRQQSTHYVCTNCHNVQQEDPDLAVSDPVARLAYAAKNDIPFLQGTTFYGIVNRETWYNDDYFKKYGSLVEPARDTLVNAIHLCAVQCSQGRDFNDWEMEAVVHYLHTIGYKLGDLGLSDADYARLNNAANGKEDKAATLTWLKSKFFTKSPAHFVDPYAMKRDMGTNGDPVNGKLIYDQGCLSCHKSDGGVTNYMLNHEKITFRQLERHLPKNSHHSAYYITRKGTYSVPGYKPYMPNYTSDRMSEKQLEDLVAYIKQQANR